MAKNPKAANTFTTTMTQEELDAGRHSDVLRIRKYGPFSFDGTHEVIGDILNVQCIDGNIYAWCAVPTGVAENTAPINRLRMITDSGGATYNGTSGSYVGTVREGPWIWHAITE